MRYNIAMDLRITALAAKNLRRNLVRTSLLLLIVTLINGGIFGASAVISGAKNAIASGVSRLGADLIVVSDKNGPLTSPVFLTGEPSFIFMDRTVLEKVRITPGVAKASAQLFLKPASLACCSDVETYLVSFDPEDDFTITPWLKKGLGKKLGEEEVLAGSALPFYQGDAVHFFGSLFTVTGIMEPTGIRFFDQSVFMTMKTAYKMAEDSATKAAKPLDVSADDISVVLVQVKEGVTPEKASINIEFDVKGVRAMPADEMVVAMKKNISSVSGWATGIILLLWTMGLLVVGLSFYMIVNERKGEIGILRALGAKRRHVFGLVVAEAVSVSAIGGGVGVSAAYILMRIFEGPIAKALNIPFLMPQTKTAIGHAAGLLALSIISGVISSVLPAAKAARMGASEAVRQKD